MRLNRLFVLAALFITLGFTQLARAETSLFAQPGRFGLGIGGTSLASGITGKVFLAKPVALQGTLGFWYGYGMDLNVDVIFEMPQLYSTPQLGLNWNLGVGGAMGAGAPGVGLGFDGVLGLGLQLRQVPLEFEAELRPTFYPDSLHNLAGFYLGAGLSIRYFFGSPR